MRVLLNECVPRQIRGYLHGHYVRTVREAGFSGYKNGNLLSVAEGAFEILFTADKNLRYQQNLSNRKLAILLLSTNKRRVVERNGERILDSVNGMKMKEFVELELK